jgi:hypothetical protein
VIPAYQELGHMHILLVMDPRVYQPPPVPSPQKAAAEAIGTVAGAAAISAQLWVNYTEKSLIECNPGNLKNI